jgi:hypothetical protein
MHGSERISLLLGLTSLLVLVQACSGAGGDALLGPNTAGATALFADAGEIPIREGLTVGADPEEIRIDPCDPDTPTDSDSGSLLGSTTIGAFVRDADLQPIVGAQVTFEASAGRLASMGDPVLTDERGLATDKLTVEEGDAGDVLVTVRTDDLAEELTVPVRVLEKPPVTLVMQPDELWPPNHKLRPVTAVFDGLDCDPEATIRLVSVESNEPDNEIGDGNTDDDIQGAEIDTADTEFLLRAERAGGGSGRVYSVVYELTDGAGASSMLEASVMVPHDQGH